MPIKLIKATRDLNVGLNTAVDFLHAKGFDDIDSNPNARISNEQYALLVKEFGKDLPDSEKRRLLNKVSDSKPIEKTPPSPKEEAKSKLIKAEIPEEFKPKIVTKGHIDLDGEVAKKEAAEPEVVSKEVQAKPEKKEEKTISTEKKVQDTPPQAPVAEQKTQEKTIKPPVTEAQEKPEQKVEKKEEHKEEKKIVLKKEKAPVEKKPVEKPQPVESESKEEEGDDLFRLNRPKLESNIKVTGKIDLSSINQSTRPKKKSKEERKKEREEKRVKTTTTGDDKKATTAQSADSAKRKRKRIKKDRVDITTTQGTNFRPQQKDNAKKPRLRKPVKAEVSEEDVQRQVKETLARLTNKRTKGNKSAKYRRDKRDAAEKRETELLQQEERESKIIKLTEFVTANDLASMMDVPVTDIISTCMSIGMMVSINQRLDAETLNIVADEFGFKTEYVSAEVSEAIKEDEDLDNEEDWVERPAIVTVMGHVDHGKTSLLDNIRNSNVIAGEAGGITQHIGAYNVTLSSGRHITFLDTPGHEAFTAMRARGAKMTDIAIIIVAADDSVMPQTKEAINHASAAGVPIVFAINKIDKPHANPEKIKEELATLNYLVEDWGGKYQSQDISAKKGIGVQELLEKVLLEADILDLKANPTRRATGSVIESSLDKGRGYVSTIMVENGTLRQGDIMIAGSHFGRIKAMFNVRNQRIEEAGPSEPALILGLDGAPQAGDLFNVLETEQEAREITTRRIQLQREQGLRTQKMLTLDDIGRRIAIGNFQELNVIVKGDVDGSVEALSDSLIGLSTEEIQVNVIHKAVGQISESDVVLAKASDAIIIGFQVRPAVAAKRLAEQDGIEVRLYSVIYDAIEDVKSAMEGMLSPEIKEVTTGDAEVQQVFKITKVGTVAGCLVKEGKIKRANKVRVIRDGIVIYTGNLDSLKRFKDEVKEVVSGLECGIHINNYTDLQVGDIIESFEQIEIKKTL